MTGVDPVGAHGRRAELAENLLTDIARLRQILFGPSLLAAVTVHGQAVVERLPEVTARDLRERAAALEALVRTHLRLYAADADTAGMNAVDGWLHSLGVGDDDPVDDPVDDEVTS